MVRVLETFAAANPKPNKIDENQGMQRAREFQGTMSNKLVGLPCQFSVDFNVCVAGCRL